MFQPSIEIDFERHRREARALRRAAVAAFWRDVGAMLLAGRRRLTAGASDRAPAPPRPSLAKAAW